MTNSKLLVEQYERTFWVIVKQTEGLSNAESVLQLPFRSNCLNWILGHIIVYREKVLEILGEEPILTDSEKAIYQRGAEPIKDGETAVSLERLLDVLEKSQKKIIAILDGVTVESLNAKAEEGNNRTVGEMLEFLQWHETYHVGQLEILRQLAGKNDAIIQ
jgi:uncharacterized damage-inducible protein DinB